MGLDEDRQRTCHLQTPGRGELSRLEVVKENPVRVELLSEHDRLAFSEVEVKTDIHLLRRFNSKPRRWSDNPRPDGLR